MTNRKAVIATTAGAVILAMLIGNYITTLSISTQFGGEYFSILVSGEGNYTYTFSSISDGIFENVSMGVTFPKGANISQTAGGSVSKTDDSVVLGWSFDKITADQSTSLNFSSDAEPTETQILATYTQNKTEKISQAISFSSEKKERKLLPLTPYGNLSKIVLNMSLSTEKNKEQEFEVLLDPDSEKKNDNEDEIAEGEFENTTSILVSFSPQQGKYGSSPYIAISSKKKITAVINSIEAVWTKKALVQESAQIISLPTTTTTLPPTTTTTINAATTSSSTSTSMTTTTTVASTTNETGNATNSSTTTTTEPTAATLSPNPISAATTTAPPAANQVSVSSSVSGTPSSGATTVQQTTTTAIINSTTLDQQTPETITTIATAPAKLSAAETIAFSAIQEANNTISSTTGKNTTEALMIFSQAMDAFNNGNYTGAEILANQAKSAIKEVSEHSATGMPVLSVSAEAVFMSVLILGASYIILRLQTRRKKLTS